MSSIASAIYNWFTVTEANEEDLPAKAFRTIDGTVTPPTAGSPVRPSEGAAPALATAASSAPDLADDGEKTPPKTSRRSSTKKRARSEPEEETTAEETTDAAPLRARSLSAVATKVQQKLEAHEEDAITKADVTKYLKENDIKVPSAAKKDELIELARTSTQVSAVASQPDASPAPEKPSRASTGRASMSRKSSSKVMAKADEDDDDDTPSLEWTVSRMKSFASKNDVALTGLTVKADIFKAIAKK